MLDFFKINRLFLVGLIIVIILSLLVVYFAGFRAMLYQIANQPERLRDITFHIWDKYPFAKHGYLVFLSLAPGIDRQCVLNELKRNGIYSVFHYVPLHSSPAGQRYGRVHGALDVTDRQAERLVRLPLWVGLVQEQQERIVNVLNGRRDKRERCGA